MDNEKGTIKAYGQINGIEEIAFVSPSPFWKVEGLLAGENQSLTGFVGHQIKKRILPHLTMNTVKTIITGIVPCRLPAKPFNAAGQGVVYASDMNFGADYHEIVLGKMQALADFISKRYGCKARAFCDTGPLVERELLFRSKKACYGRNHCMITRRFGSAFFVGYILTDQFFEPDEGGNRQWQANCGACGRCVRSCPYGAIGDGVHFHYEKCISYLTQKKGTFTVEQMQRIGNSVYGCTLCQQICPCNQNQQDINTAYFHYPLSEIVLLSNKKISQVFGTTSAGWLGKTRIVRNALAAMANSGNRNYVPLIEQFLLSDNPVLKDTAKKALYLYNVKFDNETRNW